MVRRRQRPAEVQIWGKDSYLECFTVEAMVELLLKDRWSSQAEKRGKGSESSGRMRKQGSGG